VNARVVLLDRANPMYTLPASSGVSKALAGAELVVSFGNFIDDSAAFADIILPDHHLLESSAALVPAVSRGPAVSLATPFVEPLYNTRPLEKTLADLAGKAGVKSEPSTPQSLVEPMLTEGQSFDEIARQGGLWMEPAESAPVKPKTDRLEWSEPAFA